MFGRMPRFNGVAADRLAAAALIRQLQDSEDNEAVNRLIQNGSLLVLMAGIEIIKDNLTDIRSKMEKIVSNSYEIFPDVDKKIVYDNLMKCFNHIKAQNAAMTDSDSQEIDEFILMLELEKTLSLRMNDLKLLMPQATLLVPLDEKAHKYASIRERIQLKLEAYMLQEALERTTESRSWCSIL